RNYHQPLYRSTEFINFSSFGRPIQTYFSVSQEYCKKNNSCCIHSCFTEHIHTCTAKQKHSQLHCLNSILSQITPGEAKIENVGRKICRIYRPKGNPLFSSRLMIN